MSGSAKPLQQSLLERRAGLCLSFFDRLSSLPFKTVPLEGPADSSCQQAGLPHSVWPYMAFNGSRPRMMEQNTLLLAIALFSWLRGLAPAGHQVAL